MKTTPTSNPPPSAEQDFRLHVALEIAALHVKAGADSRLRSALEKLRQARDEIAALKAEKRALARKLANIEKAHKESQKPALTDEEKEEQFRAIFGLPSKEELESIKARQEAKREYLKAD